MSLSTHQYAEREAVLSHAKAVLESLLASEPTTDLCADIEFATDDTFNSENECHTAKDRESLRVWRLLGEALSGSPTGRLPPVDLPKPFQGIEKPYSMIKECMNQIDDVKGRNGGFLSDAVRQTIDWSLSTCDPTLRSADVVGICDNIKKKHKMEKMDVMGKEYFLSGWDCDIENVVEMALHLTETVHEEEEKDPTPDKRSTPNDSPRDHGIITSRKLVLDQMVQCVEKKSSHGGWLEQNSSSIELLAFPENQSGSTEELLFQLPIQWVEMMRQCLSVLASGIQWDRLLEQEKSRLNHVSFSDPEAAAQVLHELCQRGVCDSRLLDECVLFCRTMIHKGLKAVMKLRAQFEELGGFVRGISEGCQEAVHPKVQVLRNTVITFSTLMPNTRQLILCDKGDWSDLFECLQNMRISIFQLSFPHHLSLIDSDDSREILMDYDCFFITVKDADMVYQRLAAKGNEFFKHFQRVILFDSDPMVIEPIQEVLKMMCKSGLFFCRMKPDLSDVLIRLEEPSAGSVKEDAMLPDLFCVSHVAPQANDFHRSNNWMQDQEREEAHQEQDDVCYPNGHISPFRQGPLPYGNLFEEQQGVSHPYQKSPESNYSMGIKENKSPLLFQDRLPGHICQRTENLFDKHSSSLLSLEAPCAFDRQSGIIREGPCIDALHQHVHQMPPPSYAVHDDVQNLFEEPFPSQPSKLSPLTARYGTYYAESTPQGQEMLFNTIPSYTRPVFECSPYARAVHQQPLQSQQPTYLHHASPSPSHLHSVPQFMTPRHQVTPTSFWPPVMDPMNGLKHVERLYEEMRRPKTRRRLQKGEKFRKLK